MLCGLVVEVFALIAVGGSVRLMNAGLACPDWPLCFGDVIPDYHPQVYFEFVHRVMAGLVSITTAVLVFVLLRSEAPRVVKRVAVGAVLLLITQVVFGGLTVLLQLQAKVVAAHLGMGIGFFSLLLWIYLNLKRAGEPVVPVARWVSRLSVALVLAVYGQIILGGLVASHYASLVCTDFPTCHGQWIPTLSGIIGLHVIHRLGAYTLFTFILVSWLFLRRSGIPRVKMLAGWMFALVCLQVCIGIANVLLLTPPVIAVAHLAVGTGVLSVAVRLLFESNRPAAAAA
jgi:cytochrome c oxidase assembly protein subunit 15